MSSTFSRADPRQDHVTNLPTVVPGHPWTGVEKVSALGFCAAVLTALLLPVVASMPGVAPPRYLGFLILAPLYAAAEVGVVHFRYRRDAHSFSLSEVPLILGLVFSSVGILTLAVLAGNLVALGLVRRQRGIKLWFNLASFALQTVVAMAVFRLLVVNGEMLGPWGWLAAFAASATAFLVGDALVTAAVRLTGGHLRTDELKEVVGFGLVAASVNTGLALIIVTILWLHPISVWLAVLPAVILVIAYRAYSEQRDERARLEALYDLTRALHGAPIVEDAVAIATRTARKLFEAESAHVVLVPDGHQRTAFRTSSNAEGDQHMVAVDLAGAGADLTSILSTTDGTILEPRHEEWRPLGIAPRRAVMVAPLCAGSERIGVVLVADPLSAVGSFHERDVKVLETLAGRLGVSLENGRLEGSLLEVTRLKDRLEDAVRSKDQFIASVSHELRTPLTGIVGLSQELKNNRDLFDPSELDEFLGHIHEQSSELGNIIEDLLVAARADTGTLVVKPTSVDLRRELGHVLATQAAKSGSKNLVVEVRGRAPAVLADPLRLRQIVRNLLSNAVRYGGDEIWVEISELAGIVTISVVDTGDGVPEESLDRIFQAYGRAEGGNANPASVGLGLSVSLQLARLMNGDLRYRRLLGDTRFELLLPVVCD